jgi:hypothetical protein
MTGIGPPLILIGFLCLAVGFICMFFYGLTYPWVIPSWVNYWWLAGFGSLVSGILVTAWPLVVFLVCYFLDKLSGR